MRAAVRERPVVRFFVMAVVFAGLSQALNVLLGGSFSLVAAVLGGVFFGTLMYLTRRYWEPEDPKT